MTIMVDNDAVADGRRVAVVELRGREVELRREVEVGSAEVDELRVMVAFPAANAVDTGRPVEVARMVELILELLLVATDKREDEGRATAS